MKKNYILVQLVMLIGLVLFSFTLISCGGDKGDSSDSWLIEAEGTVTEGDAAHPIIMTYAEEGIYEKYFYDPNDDAKLVYRERRKKDTDEILARILGQKGKETTVILYKKDVPIKIFYLNPDGTTAEILDLISKIGVQD